MAVLLLSGMRAVAVRSLPVLYCFLPVISAVMHPPLDDTRDLLEQKALFVFREVSTHSMLLMMTMIASLVGYCSNCMSGEDESMLWKAE